MNFDYEVIQTNENLPIKFIMSHTIKNHKNAFIVPHWHDSYELIFLKEGTADIIVNGEHYLINQNEFFLIDSQAVHSIYYTDDVSMVLQIPRIVLKNSSIHKERIAIDSAKVCQGNQRILELLNSLFAIYQTQAFGYIFKVNAIIYDMLFILLTDFKLSDESEFSIISQKGERRFLEIINYIKEHFYENLKLKQVADAFDLSEEYLSRFIKKNSNETFKGLLTKIRLEFAYRDLLNTDYTLLDIALKNGFPSTKAFNKCFLEKYHCLPSEYRKSQKKS